MSCFYLFQFIVFDLIQYITSNFFFIKSNFSLILQKCANDMRNENETFASLKGYMKS